MAFKSIEDTFVYKHLNGANGLSDNVFKAMKEGKILNKANLEEAFLIINKNFKFPLKYKVMEAFDRGDIVLLFSPPSIRIPTCMPFFLTKTQDNRVVSVVCVDIYGKMNMENGNVTIDAKKLYCMMEGAYIARLYYYQHNQIAKRNIIISAGSSIYANMFTRVLNKKYALNVDKTKMHKVLFLASKFFMINVLGMDDNEIVYNYALRNCVNANQFLIKQVNSALSTEDYSSLSTFIVAISKQETGIGLTDLATRSYLELFITMYDPSTLLGLEYFPYFAYNIIAVSNAAYINNQHVLEDIVDKQGPKIYVDLTTIAN